MSAAPKRPESIKIEADPDSRRPPLYHVTKLEKCRLDQNGPSGYRYIIEGGYAPITGFHIGSKEHVLGHASTLAKEMNARRGVKGTKHIVIGKPKTA